MSQPDTREGRDAQGEKQPAADDSDVTKIDWFTIIVVPIGLIIGVAWFIQMIIESFFKK